MTISNGNLYLITHLKELIGYFGYDKIIDLVHGIVELFFDGPVYVC
jgi:hypothetical protein